MATLAEELAGGLSAAGHEQIGRIFSDLTLRELQPQAAGSQADGDARPAAASGQSARVRFARRWVRGKLKLCRKREDAGFDRPAAPTLIEINPLAKQKDVVEAVKARLKTLQSGLGRRRTKFDDGDLENRLAVRDLREGWTGSGYDLSARHSSKQVMERLGFDSTSTENDRYHAAFSLVTGHEYSSEK